MSEFTTVKVAKSTRDRLNAIASSEGATAGGLIERLLDDYIWRHRMEDAVRVMRSSPPDVRIDFQADVRSPDALADDALADDGLEEYAGDAWAELT